MPTIVLQWTALQDRYIGTPNIQQLFILFTCCQYFLWLRFTCCQSYNFNYLLINLMTFSLPVLVRPQKCKNVVHPSVNCTLLANYYCWCFADQDQKCCIATKIYFFPCCAQRITALGNFAPFLHWLPANLDPRDPLVVLYWQVWTEVFFSFSMWQNYLIY